MQRDGADALYREIGQAVRTLRMRRLPKMGQQALASAVGVSRASIANIERGHHRVQLHVLYNIAMVLDVEPHDLMPHADRQVKKTRLPQDLTKELSAREVAAVDRLIRSGSKGVPSNEKS